MKEIYDWVPWFKELGERIAEGGDHYLIDRSKTVEWKSDGSAPAILKCGDENICLTGTMNTADRSIKPLDMALRRRITFVEMTPEPEHQKPAGISMESIAPGC